MHNDKKNERKKERKKERSATRISYRPNIVLLGIQQGMEGTIDEFISREQFSSFLCPYFCFEHGVRTREEEEEEEEEVNDAPRIHTWRVSREGRKARGKRRGRCTRTRKMCVVNCHPRSIRAPSLARAVTRMLRIVVMEAVYYYLFTCLYRVGKLISFSQSISPPPPGIEFEME